MHKSFIYLTVIILSIIVSFFKIKFYIDKNFRERYEESNIKDVDQAIWILLLIIIVCQQDYLKKVLLFLVGLIYCGSTLIFEFKILKKKKVKSIIASFIINLILLFISIYFMLFM